MPNIILLNKPFQVLSQFTDNSGRETLKRYLPNKPGFYVAGRLDYDSEGLLLLTDHGPLQHYIAHPQFNKQKTYWVQVEGEVTPEALQQLSQGVTLKDGKTKPAIAKKIDPPSHIWSREPPIRERKNIPTSWVSLSISEGKNRQVRRMTAAVGFPTLRLIRASIGEWSLDNLQPGDFAQAEVTMPVTPKALNPSKGDAKGHSKNRSSLSKTSQAKRSVKKR